MILEDKTVLVSGVGAGLGREVARLALRDGARVVLAARTESVLARTAEELDPSGDRIAYRRADITKPEDCEALAATAVERFGKVDAMVQVAAYENVFGGLYDGDFEKWRRAFETNVIGSLTLIRAVAPQMKKAGGGSLVLIGSLSMYLPQLPQAGYAASTDQVGHRHAYRVEQHLAGIHPSIAELGELGCAVPGLLLDQQQAHTAVCRRRVGIGLDQYG